MNYSTCASRKSRRHWATGNLEVPLTSQADLDAVKPFMNAAYEGRDQSMIAIYLVAYCANYTGTGGQFHTKHQCLNPTSRWLRTASTNAVSITAT
jgi:hypothetical protein